MTHPLFVDAQAVMQGIATELAFVDTNSQPGLRKISASLLQLKQLYGTASASDINEELNWFDCTSQTELLGLDSLSSDKLDMLHQWYERLEAALNQWRPAVREQNTSLPADDATEEAPLALNLDEDAELLNEFCNEGRDLLHNIEQGILVLEENPKHADTLNLRQSTHYHWRH